jgi:ABC-2 type transport system ATP-binding protein
MEILEFVGLDKFSDRRAGLLSGGMKQKLGLASALVTRPKVLLLDEPTTGVDPVTRQDFWQLVIRLSTQVDGVSVIISTPYMDEASRCHRVGFMKAGKIIAEDTPSNLRARLNNRILMLRGMPLHILRHTAHIDVDVEDVQAFGDRLHIRVGENKAQDVLHRLPAEIRSAGGEIEEFRLIPPVLEDVFIALSDHEYSIKGVQA